MTPTYSGPLRSEPLAIELHNTVYAAQGGVADGLAGDAGTAWLDAIDARLPAGGSLRRAQPRAADLLELRAAVREALQAAIAGEPIARSTLEALNAASARAPRSPVADWRPDGPPLAAVDVHGATRADVILAALAADAIEILTGPRRADLHACGAPGCVLLFLSDHPRREWCSNACGNRARQARHYRRMRRSP